MCIYICFLSRIVYINYPYTNSCSFLLNSREGWISSPQAWRSQHGHKHRRIAAGVKSRNLGLWEGIRSIPHQYHGSFRPPSFANPQFRHSHLQFWLCSPGGSTLHFSKYFSFSPSTKRHHFFKVKSFPKDKSRYNGTLTFFENSDVCKKTNRISV